MKQLIITLFFYGLFFAVPVSAEQIDHYNVDLRVSSHGTVSVVERIQMNYGEQERHGLVRSITYEVNRGDDIHEIRVSDIMVRDTVGRELSFSTLRKDGFIDVKIGDESMVTGIQDYVLSYQLDYLVYYLDIFDELTWYAVGADWLFPIGEAVVTVRLPEPVALARIKMGCSVVSRESQTDCEAIKYENREDGTVQTIVMSQSLLPEGHGVLAMLQLPKDAVFQPRPLSQVLWWMIDNWLTLVAGMVVLGALWLGGKKII